MKRREIFFIIILVIFLLIGGCGGSGGSGGDESGSSGGTISLAWDSNTEADLAGYKVYYGTAPGVYGTPIDVGMATQSSGTTYYTLPGLTKGQTYYIVVTAYDTSSNESGYSNPGSGAAK